LHEFSGTVINET